MEDRVERRPGHLPSRLSAPNLRIREIEPEVEGPVSRAERAQHKHPPTHLVGALGGRTYQALKNPLSILIGEGPIGALRPASLVT